MYRGSHPVRTPVPVKARRNGPMSRARFWKKVLWIDRSTEDPRDAAASIEMNTASWTLLFHFNFSILECHHKRRNRSRPWAQLPNSTTLFDRNSTLHRSRAGVRSLEEQPKAQPGCRRPRRRLCNSVRPCSSWDCWPVLCHVCAQS